MINGTPQPASLTLDDRARDAHDEHAPLLAPADGLPPDKRATPELIVDSVVLGDLLLRPQHAAKYRDDLIGSPSRVDRVHVCPRCFKYSVPLRPYLAHCRQCPYHTPPGRLVYRAADVALHEVDGKDQWLFAQNISLFAKLFIDQKSVCFDVAGFLFYLLVKTEPDAHGHPESRVVGFFSKEKLSWDLNNLACIVVFPPWQKQGLGQLLMAASYAISKREGKIGGPEKPLSAMGQQSYTAYWSHAIALSILAAPANAYRSMDDISDDTYILTEDVVATLRHMDVLSRPRSDGSYAIAKDRIRAWLAARGLTEEPLLDPAGFVD